MEQILINQKMLVTFWVALHYVRPDSYHMFMSCDIVELRLFYWTWLETCPDLSRQFCFVCNLQSCNGINILVYFGNWIFAYWTNRNEYCGIFKGLIWSWKHLAGSPSRTEAGGIMDGRRVKERKKNPQDKYYAVSERISVELSMKTPNKENVTAKLQDIDKPQDELLELLDSLQTLYRENLCISSSFSPWWSRYNDRSRG